MRVSRRSRRRIRASGVAYADARRRTTLAAYSNNAREEFVKDPVASRARMPKSGFYYRRGGSLGGAVDGSPGDLGSLGGDADGSFTTASSVMTFSPASSV